MLKVLFEDNHLLVCFKEKGILSQGNMTDNVDMLTLCKAYLKEKYQKPGNVFVGLVHRLDKDTSGVMVFAKTSKCASRLSEAIRCHEFEKRYFAIVDGKLSGNGSFTDYLLKEEQSVTSKIVDQTVKNAKLAKLNFQVITNGVNKNMPYSVVDIKLITGRHHQIRAQFSHHQHPLCGDTLYNGSKNEDGFLLHAYFLSFPHPITKEIMEFTLYPEGKSWSTYYDFSKHE